MGPYREIFTPKTTFVTRRRKLRNIPPAAPGPKIYGLDVLGWVFTLIFVGLLISGGGVIIYDLGHSEGWSDAASVYRARSR